MSHPCCSSTPCLSFSIYRMGMNTMPTSGHPLSHHLLALALRSRQGRAGQGRAASSLSLLPHLLPFGPEAQPCPFSWPAELQAVGSTCLAGVARPPIGPREPSGPLERVPPAVRGEATAWSCPLPGGCIVRRPWPPSSFPLLTLPATASRAPMGPGTYPATDALGLKLQALS